MDALAEIRANPKALYNATEVGHLVGRDPRSIRRACDRGQIPSVRVGRLRLIAFGTLQRLLSGEPLEPTQ